MARPRIIQSIRERGSLRDLARWLFLGTLVIAPWLYGGTTAWSIEIINGMLGLTLALWVASLLLDRRWPLVPRRLVIIAAIILFHGWWMVANASAIYDSTFFMLVPIRTILPGAPGSSDQVLSLVWMLRATALLGVACLAAELSQRPVWFLRLWYTIALAGGSIALFGLLQKGTGAQMIFWRSLDGAPEFKTFFATFYYHANAGAFLNLVLPTIAGLALWIVARQRSPVARATWLTTLMLVVIAVLSNTSRMAQVVGAMLTLAMIAVIARPVLRMVARMDKRTMLVGAFVIVITAFAVALTVHLDEPFRRWQTLSDALAVDARWLADRAALSGIGDAGWFGFGPGSFRAIFPHYQQIFPNLQGTWRFLHNDYLQTILEWGWFGSAAIAALFFGGIGTAIHSYFKATTWSNRQRILLACVTLALGGVAIHALVDFPLQILSIQLLVATYLGVCWGSARWQGERKGESRRTRSEVGDRPAETDR